MVLCGLWESILSALGALWIFGNLSEEREINFILPKAFWAHKGLWMDSTCYVKKKANFDKKFDLLLYNLWIAVFIVKYAISIIVS